MVKAHRKVTIFWLFFYFFSYMLPKHIYITIDITGSLYI